MGKVASAYSTYGECMHAWDNWSGRQAGQCMEALYSKYCLCMVYIKGSREHHLFFLYSLSLIKEAL